MEKSIEKYYHGMGGGLNGDYFQDPHLHSLLTRSKS